MLINMMLVELVSYSEPALRNNSSVVEYCRTSMSALSGCTAGILGLTGLSGFVFYIFSVLALCVSHIDKYFFFLIYFILITQVLYQKSPIELIKKIIV